MRKPCLLLSITGFVAATGCGGTTNDTAESPSGGASGTGAHTGGASSGGSSGTGAAGAGSTHEPCDTPSLPWPGDVSEPSGCALSGWSRGSCTDTAPSDPAWSCIEGTIGCKQDQTCFIGVTIIGECPANTSVTFSCKGLDGNPVVVTKPLPTYPVCTPTNPCTEVTSGFVCAPPNSQTSGVVDGSITIDGLACELE